MLTILIPAAGEGKRFRDAGYSDPKPLIPVRGVPMLRRVVDNVRPAGGCRWLFVFRAGLDYDRMLKEWGLEPPDTDWVGLHHPTSGAAKTCLLAANHVALGEPLLVANCDQLVEGGIAPLLATDADAAVLTMHRPGESKWSYLKFLRREDWVERDEPERVIEKPSVPHRLTRATTGHYYFRRAGDFFSAAECMIALGDRTNGEFYVAPALNYLVAARKTVVEVRVEDYGGTFVGLGTPEDLKLYEESQ